MDPNDIPIVRNWLSQFDIPDIYMAEHILRRMRYVGFEEFEKWLHTSVNEVLETIVKESGRSAVAIFPISKPFIHNFNKQKEAKSPNDSAGRIAHSLKNIERDLPDFVELTPRLDSMRKRKVKNIIFVDDFVGTGDRFIKSWNSSVSRTVKSWCSFGWCKIWFITFAAHESGIKKILKNVHAIDPTRIKINIVIDQSMMLQNAAMKLILKKYGAKLGDSAKVMGYGGLATPIIFQHGCPNNVPLIFWVKPSKSRRSNWKPLFPDRSVSAEVYPLFSADLARAALPEELWMNGHYQLALNFMNTIKGFGQDQHHLLLILTLLSTKKTLAHIKRLMILPSGEFERMLVALKQGGAIDENTTLSRFGRDIVARLSRRPKLNAKITEEKYYFPSSFSGFRREA